MSLSRPHILLTLPLLLAGASAVAQSSCSSDGTPQPVAVLERFISADCEACWSDAATPRAAANELVLDWIVPGRRGEDAPLSMGASRDALARLQALGRKPPERADAARKPLAPPALPLRVAQGLPFNDYIGASIELQPGAAGPWRAWLLLVEVLPAGAEGSPVPRNLVRNVFEPPWDGAASAGAGQAPQRLHDMRAMQIHEGTRASRLRVVGLVEDARGRIRGIARSECAPAPAGR